LFPLRNSLSVAVHPLPSFPTRRSSDLSLAKRLVPPSEALLREAGISIKLPHTTIHSTPNPLVPKRRITAEKNRHTRGKMTAIGRSEEHTSELQSRFDLVCRLLLEKKNK